MFKGLTYDYMRTYIFTHEPKETKKDVLEEMEEMILISKCHSNAKRYPVIKNWFLEKYPEVKEFGMKKPEEKKVVAEIVETNEVALKKTA